MIETGRLRLRRWRESDRDPFYRMNSDPEVMRYFPGVLTRQESDAMVDRIEAQFSRRGFSLYAVELPGLEPFIGFIGLSEVTFQAPFTPAVEIGWRLASAHWGQGLATEGARRILAYAFDDLGLSEIVSFTVPGNLPSRRVMQKIGMHRDPDGDFDHPRIPADHPMRHHVLYRVVDPRLQPAARAPFIR